MPPCRRIARSAAVPHACLLIGARAHGYYSSLKSKYGNNASYTHSSTGMTAGLVAGLGVYF